jgi:hypothetical protein
MAAPQPSARFVRAVAAERAELERHRARMAGEAAELRAALARIEHGLAEIDERFELLDRLELSAGVPDGPAADSAEAPHRTLLRGPAIRERAVHALLESGRDSLHYRRWFELVADDGYAIAGKDPLAVFLTQITRSPVIQRGATAGVYALDRHAPERLEQTLQRLQRDLARTVSDRTRRARITAEIGRTERALEEATQALDPGSRLTAATA